MQIGCINFYCLNQFILCIITFRSFNFFFWSLYYAKRLVFALSSSIFSNVIVQRSLPIQPFSPIVPVSPFFFFLLFPPPFLLLLHLPPTLHSSPSPLNFSPSSSSLSPSPSPSRDAQRPTPTRGMYVFFLLPLLFLHFHSCFFSSRALVVGCSICNLLFF